MKIVPAVEVAPHQWDEVCRQSSLAWLFHERSWMALEERFFGQRGLSFGVVDDSRGLIGVHPLYCSTLVIGWNERVVHSGIHRHTGLALVDDLPAATVREAWSSAMGAVMAAAAAEDADRIQLNTQNLAPANLAATRDEIPVWVREYDFNLGMNFGPNGMIPAPGMATCCADQIVALAPDEATLFGRLNRKCRGAVRKAQKAGVEFEASTDDGMLESYWQLAQAGAERTGEQLPPREYYETLIRELQPKGQCAIVFARVAGRRVAGVLLAIDKGALSFLGGVSNPDYLPMRVNNFLHWSAMIWAKAMGHQHYRFGPAFPEVPEDWPIARVSWFKEQFGGHSLTTIQGSFFLKPEKYLAGAVDHLSRLCAMRAAVGSDQT